MRRLAWEWCLIALAACGIIIALQTSHATDRVDNAFYDVLQGVGAPQPSDRIMLVEIDDHSLATIGRWPWPRDVHARFLKRLAEARTTAVAYDALFTERGPAGKDAELGRAIGTLGNVAVPVLFVAPGSNGRAIDTRLPVAPVAGAARAIGQVALLPDVDGVARSVPLYVHAGQRDWPHLMEQTYRIATGRPSPIFSRVVSGNDSRVFVHFQPESGRFRSISFASVLAGEVPQQFLQGRILLVGATAAGLGDSFRVPSRTGTLISGIELQANLLNALLADRTITRPGIGATLAFGLGPTLILLITFWRLQPSHVLATAIILMMFVLAIPALLLLLADIWFAPTPALAGLLLVYPLWGWRRLNAVNSAIGQELRAFAAERSPIPLAAPKVVLQDAIGGQTARLRAAISHLRDMRQLVTDTIDGVNDPLLVTDLDDRIILANQAASQLFGVATQGSLATSLLRLRGGVETDCEALPPELGIEDRTFALYRFPLREHAGGLCGWILHLSDMTEIKRAQQEREDVLAFLSHDMRSPQSSIITLLEQGREWITDAGVAGRIGVLAQRTLSLADNFVQLVRFSAVEFEPEEMDLAEVLIDAADELWPLASRSAVRISVAGREGGAYLLGERDALFRAFVNLLDNAVKFSPEGGTVHCAVSTVEGQTIECSIEDEGPGIPPERQHDLFARFGSRKRGAGSGLSAGLGLALVRATIDRHQGTIVHQSADPHGARFVLRFPPLVPEATLPPQERSAPEQVESRTKGHGSGTSSHRFLS